jgi:hypothetical protein
MIMSSRPAWAIQQVPVSIIINNKNKQKQKMGDTTTYLPDG